MSVIEEIKERLDIVQYIGQYVPLKKAGKYYKACCPFHQEKTPSFMVSEERQTWRCYGACGVGGDLIDFAMRQHSWTIQEAVSELAKQAGMEYQKSERHERLDRLRGLLAAAAESYHTALLSDMPGAQQAYDYLTGRGIQPDTIAEFQLGFATENWQAMTTHLRQLGYADQAIVATGLAKQGKKGLYDLFRNRLMIPIRDKQGRVVGFGARALKSDDQPKYLNSPQTKVFDKSHLLFGLDRVPRGVERIVIVEGYMDVIQAHQHGLTNVVAQMGTALTDAQVALLPGRKPIILALDGDTAGQNATQRSLQQALKVHWDVRILELPVGEDPDSILRQHSAAYWAQQVDQAVPVAEYLIIRETAHVPEDASLAERSALARRLLPVIMASESDVYSMWNVQLLALHLRLPERELMTLARQQLAEKSASPPETPPPPFKPDRYPIEAYCLNAMLQDDGVYYQIQRQFRELELDDFEEADFSGYRQVFRIFIEALAQDALPTAEYLYSQVDGALLPPVSEEPLHTALVIDQALRLRIRRLQAEISELAHMGTIEQVLARNRAVAQIAQHRQRN